MLFKREIIATVFNVIANEFTSVAIRLRNEAIFNSKIATSDFVLLAMTVGEIVTPCGSQ